MEEDSVCITAQAAFPEKDRARGVGVPACSMQHVQRKRGKNNHGSPRAADSEILLPWEM